MVTLTTVRKWLQQRASASAKELPDSAYPCPVDKAPDIEQALCSYRTMTF